MPTSNFKRITIDETMLAVAIVMSSRSTCARRAVGCVLTDEKGRILSTGYNGVARGMPHCYWEQQCASVGSQSGTNLDGCAAVHAEQNAILMLRDPDKLYTCYTTTSPCMNCVKLLINTSCQRIIYLNEYGDVGGVQMWYAAKRQWIKYPLGITTPLDSVLYSIGGRKVIE